MAILNHTVTRQRGYTLLELLMTVAVSTTLLGLAAPSFSKWVQESSISTETRNFVALLNHARTEALARNIAITLDTEIANRIWSGPITVHTDISDNSDYDTGTDVLVRQVSARDHGLIITGDSAAGNWISFDSLGRLAESGSVARVAICDDRGKTHGSVITINLLGHISVDPASSFTSTEVDPTTCEVATFS